jgi:hypothetical protein
MINCRVEAGRPLIEVAWRPSGMTLAMHRNKGDQAAVSPW